MNKKVFLIKNLFSLGRLVLYSNFPKLYPFIPPNILVASLKITGNCNSKCVGCNFGKEISKDLTYDEWVKIFDQFKEIDIKLVRFSGGEPMMREDILDLLAYVKKLGLNASIQSNILLLDVEKIKKMVEIGVNKIAISIDGIGEEYQKFRGLDAFDEVEKKLILLKKYFHEKIDITPTIADASIGSLKNVIEYAKKKEIPIAGFNIINFTHYFFVDEEGTNRKSYENVDRSELKAILKYVAENRGKYLKPQKYDLYAIYKYFENYMLPDLPCMNPVYKLCIGSEGNVYGCCSQDPCGNALEVPLKEIIKSEALHKVALSALNRTCPGCNCGLTLNSRLSLKYRIMPYFSKFLTNHSG